MSKTVRMRKQISGTRNGAYWPAPGGTLVVEDDEAELLIRNGQAVVEGDPLPDEEYAVEPEAEVAVVPPKGRRPISAEGDSK